MSCVGLATESLAAGFKQIDAGKHYFRRLFLGLLGQRQMDSHLVAVKIGVESGANHRRNANGQVLYQTGLNAWIPSRWSVGARFKRTFRAGDDFFQNFPYFPEWRLQSAAVGVFDAVRHFFLMILPMTKGLENFQRHFLGRPHSSSLRFGPTTMTERPE